MRTTVVLALVLVACGPSDRRESPARHDTPSPSSTIGPDAIVLRIPRSGGVVRAYHYPQLDSVIWTSSSPAAPPARVLAFDGDAGSIAYVDRKDTPGRIDLRAGTVGVASRARLTSLTSSDGWAIYGIAAKGGVTRLTPTGDWSFKPPAPVRLLLPQSDGSLLVLTGDGDDVTVLRVRPPESEVTDSTTIPATRRIVHAQAGDRIYFGIDSSLLALRSRTLERLPSLRFDNAVRAIVPTPSGDRLFVLTDSSRRLVVVDRYRDHISGSIDLPGTVSALRMDPLGRYLLARPTRGDSAWIIALGTSRVTGTVSTEWREDLPFVAPDGALALAEGKDVRFVSGDGQQQRAVVKGGAADFWHVILWNGFRPRAGELDQPVTFGEPDTMDIAGDSSVIADSAGAFPGASPDSRPPGTSATPRQGPVRPPRSMPSRPIPPRLPVDTSAGEAAHSSGWIVSFAAYVSEPPARQRAASINVAGQKARVVASRTAGTTVYRVVLGPYPTRAEAERVGRQSGASFWVYEGNP